MTRSIQFPAQPESPSAQGPDLGIRAKCGKKIEKEEKEERPQVAASPCHSHPGPLLASLLAQSVTRVHRVWNVGGTQGPKRSFTPHLILQTGE